MHKIFIAFMLSTLLLGCSKEEITAFKADAAVNFVGTTFEYSFLGNPAGEYIQAIPVRIIGDTTTADRNFTAQVVRDTNTTAADNQYQIMGGVVPAGKMEGVLRVKVLNAPELSKKSIAVKLKLVNGNDFKAGNIESSQFLLSWTDKLVLPSWTYYRAYFSNASSSAVYRLIVQTTGLTKFTITEYRIYGVAGSEALATKFGDYVKQWNKDHPNDHLKHDDGTQAGNDIVPLFYTRSKYD